MPNDVKYDRHEQEWSLVLTDKKRKTVGESWLDKSTLDYWRHSRMRSNILSIIKNDPQARWLTVGDGRFGTDGNYLLNNGAKNVHCSDISDTLLRIGKQKGFINEFSSQNAEYLKFSNNFFDYILCKESLHHFPRPYAAMYEMMRVARKAVILIEPLDNKVSPPLFSKLFNLLRVLLRKKSQEHTFETVGNYVYSISVREIEKFCLGMHYRDVAFKSMNDAYLDGGEFISLTHLNSRKRAKTLWLKLKIRLLDALCSLRLKSKTHLLAIVFKEQPEADIVAGLRNDGWDVKRLPLNPFLDR